MKFPWKYILVSFLIGLLFGGSTGLFYAGDLVRHWHKKGPEIFLKRLDHELHLTDSQRTKILAILTTNRQKMDAYHDETRKAARMQIRALLTPAQQPGFDALIARHDAKRLKAEDR